MPNLKASLFVIICFLFVLSCKKEKPAAKTTPVNNELPDSTRDFMFIPMKDARWISVYRGTYVVTSQTGDYYYDSSYRMLIEIIAIGRDTMVKNRRYFLFQRSDSAYSSKVPSNGYSSTEKFYIREDTANKMVYNANEQFEESLLLSFHLEVGAKIGKYVVISIDSFLMNGKYLKRWNTSDISMKFIQAYGVGYNTGLYKGPNPGNGSFYNGTTFFYNSDSILVY